MKVLKKNIALGVPLVICCCYLLSACGSTSAFSRTANVIPLGSLTPNKVENLQSDSPEQSHENQNKSNDEDDEKKDQSDKKDKEKKRDAKDSVVYQYAVYPSEAFAIIDSLSTRCTACHRIGKKGNARGAGPSLNGIKERAEKLVPGLSAREYIKQSIVNPSAFIANECPNGPCVDVMVKIYDEELSDDQLDTLVNYLLSLDEE